MNKGLKKILIGLLVLSVFGVIVYGLFFAPILANNKAVIEARNQYVQTAARIDRSLGITDSDSNYFQPPFRVFQAGEAGGFQYIFSGRLERIEPDQQIMYFRCCGDQLFGFKIKMNLNYLKDGLVMVSGVEVDGNQNKQRKWLVFNADDVPATKELDPNFDDSVPYWIVWQDQRSLSAILKAYKNNPEAAVNLTAEDVINFVR